jgi:hypothetical protein
MARKPKVGECITLRLERRPIYANPSYVEAARETTKTFEVSSRHDYTRREPAYTIRPTSGNRRPLQYTPAKSSGQFGYLWRGSPAPLRYDVIEVIKIGKCRRRRK